MDDSSAHKAAKASRYCAIFVTALLYVSRSMGAERIAVLEMFMLLMAAGLLLGVFALFGIRNYGAKGILAPALMGIAINGAVLYVCATHFFAHRSPALANGSVIPELNPAAWTQSGANTRGSYRSEGLSFDYGDAYELKTSNDGIVLWNGDANSKVVIMCLPKSADMDKALKRFVSGMQQSMRNKSCTGFTQTDVEKLEGTILSGSVIRTEFDKPAEGRFHADVYLLSAGNNAITVAHSYPDKMTTTAGGLFATVLHSLKDGSSDVRQSAAASQVAATPIPTRTGPPELRSIMWIPTRPSAQLDQRFAFEGDTVRGYKVTKIRHDGVDLLTPEGAPLKLVLAAQIAGK